jgi:hypothetical protein
MSYAPSYPQMFRRAAAYVDKILRGEKPGELPVEQPVVFDLVLNMKTARSLGLEVPPGILIRASELIEWKYGLAINLQTAKALGLTVPPTLLARADEVIEWCEGGSKWNFPCARLSPEKEDGW